MNRFVSALIAVFVVAFFCNVSWAGKLGPEFQVGSSWIPNYDNEPGVAGLADGGFIVTWEAPRKKSDTLKVFGQQYKKTGKRNGKVFRVSFTTKHNNRDPSVAGLVDGGFVVTWESPYKNVGGTNTIFGQRFDAAGNPVGASQFRINSDLAHSQRNPSVAALADGGFVVTWESGAQDGSQSGVYGQRYDAAGNRVGQTEFRVNKTTTNVQDNPSVAGLDGGGFVVT